MAGLYYLENDHIRIAVHKSGIITSIYNKKTGTEFIEKNKGWGWKFVVTLRGWTEYPVFDYMNSGRVAKKDDGIEISFSRLKGLEGDILSVSMKLYFTLFSFSVKSSNRFSLSSLFNDIVYL